MNKLTPALAAEHAAQINFGTVNRRHKYKGIDKYLQHACNEGGLLKDEFLLWVFKEQGFDLDDTRDNKSVKDVLSLFDLLSLYGKKAEFNYHKEHLQQAISLAWSAFGRKEWEAPLSALPADISILAGAIKLERSSGYPSFDSKANDLSRAFSKYTTWKSRLHSGAPCFLPPCVAYSRIQHGEQGPKTRLVWGYSLEATLAEAVYARPLIDRFLALSTPIAFGYLRHEIGSKLQPIIDNGVVYCLDYSKFDTSVPAFLIDVAFNILSSHFILEGVDKVEWDSIVHHFIHTPIIMPDGHLYIKHQGVPSGSFFTQLVDSIVNYILLQYVAIHCCSHAVGRSYVMVLGDDSIFSIPRYLPLETIKRCLFKSFGMTVNISKSCVSTSGNLIHFLGHSWNRLVVERSPDEIAKRIVYPERFNSKIPFEELRKQRIAGYLADGQGVAPLFRSLIFGTPQDIYALWLNLRVGKGPVTGYQEWLDSLGLFTYESENRKLESNCIPAAYVGVYK